MMFLHAVKLAILAFALPGCCNAVQDDSIIGIASPDNFILYEKTRTEFSSQPSMPLKIKSNIPVTIQRYDDMDESWESDPINAGDGIILVTSNCDTGDTTVVPIVTVVQDENGATLVNVELGVATEEASQMPFLDSSSYNATWGEYGCGWYTIDDLDTQKPTMAPTKKTSSITLGGAVEPTVCLELSDCDAMRQKMGITSSLYVGDYQTKGCFSKNGIAYWGSGGSIDDKSKTSLQGIQERVWCEKELDISVGSPSDGLKEDRACITQGKCDEMRLEMGISSFQVGGYPTKGCFSKNNVAYWGSGGSVEEMSSSNLAGIQERLWCKESSATTPQTSPCETGPNANPEKSCGRDNNKFCQLEAEVCNDRSGIHNGVCATTPDVCNEMYMPVCGCDGNTYGNKCKAESKGMNVSREGKCMNSAEGEETEKDIACLTKGECDEQRQEMGIGSFYSGDYPTKGCFIKNGRVFYSEGSIAAMSEAISTGKQERIWCTKKRSSTINAALQQANTNAVTQVQHESATSSASSLKSFMLGSLLYNAVSSQAAKPTRALDTCTYNVEVLLSGCAGSGTPTEIEVAAPKARVINSVIENTKKETFAVHESFKDEAGTQLYNKEFKNTATLTFPDNEAELITVLGDDYAAIPLLEQDKCWQVVCGRPFVDSDGHSLLASPFSTEECGGTSSWLGEVSLDEGEKSMETQASSPVKNQNQLILGEEWTKSALGEHASVASFAAFSIALMTNQAPSNLVEDSLKAALDEVRHTKTSFDIASKLMRKSVGPGPLPPSSHQFNHDLTTLAMSVAKEGCVDETLSALAAAAEVELIDDVLKNGVAEGNKYFGIASELLVWIRDELHTISMDESNHSALAWRTLDWVCAVEPGTCELVKQSVLDENQLIAAFQRRFGSDFKDTPELLERMMVAWSNIYTSQNIQSAHNVTVNDVCGSVCIGDFVRERNSNNLPDPSLLSLLVENISRGGLYQ
eukprot:CAMPEP_0172309484 /NCGR_PEP_ID=MMETSP1058-20130122/9749_1 /TAXON_ID=83371 /ORGANISM="Detonula confervacea, Strain CCMP 353" /LENGTH=973 /DNA_ID=CAMNT_0013022113 /DNA_START=8 /DNA_END=2929 /DNA_ORIENTATION=-